ncbi:MAG: hypothetical protein Q6K31_10515 [Gloeomargarita sp. GMQP_bins_14]
MPRTKLTPADRSQIAQRFRETSATATSLAAEYDVSISTIIRILKEELTEAVYESLVPQKRAGRWQESSPSTPPAPATGPKIRAYKPVTDAPPETGTTPAESPVLVPPPAPPDRETSASEVEVNAPLPEPELETLTPLTTEETTSPPVLPEWDVDAQDDWDEEEGDSLEEEEPPAPGLNAPSLSQQILPLDASVLPPTCYLVVDRFAELVVRPLTEFSRWGELPTVNAAATTLPVFDNHRVAKRFSGRHHRVVKVPDGQLIYKTSPYLYDKGITHLLINGQVYTVTPKSSPLSEGEGPVAEPADLA